MLLGGFIKNYVEIPRRVVISLVSSIAPVLPRLRTERNVLYTEEIHISEFSD